MPLTRYQIRNEFSLADPELYRAADRDDPEALLEGVAMAGLVGVLRQLGDLAEFAAEIFHDLHEEVMATAARGHGLMARVQQLEAEFPSIEKTYLSQTNYSLFFSNAGVDWHPNLRTEQNLIACGDLPRFVMDSYEECRGPPRLFLLDKFDVAGAGACLKRYTDPSFFKFVAASSEVSNMEAQRERKIRKVKKKGSRWRNVETPDNGPMSHAKLHELFLEERIENGHSDPARLVKLKKRQLNGSAFDSKYGRSYMEKYLETPSQDHRVIHEISVAPPPLKLTMDNSSELGLEIIEIGAVSPRKMSSPGKGSECSSPNAQEVVLKPFVDDLNGEIIDKAIVKEPEPTADHETDEIHSILHELRVEKELVVDGESKTEGSVYGDHYDDVTSEVDNYMDALTTMESEMDTDNECRPKNNLGFINVGKHVTVSDGNEVQLDIQGHFSDCHSFGNSSDSNDGNSSLKKGTSIFSYSDTLSNLAENTPSDGEEAARVFPSTETCVAEITDLPFNQLSAYAEILETKSSELVLSSDSNLQEASLSSCPTGPNSMLLYLDPGTSSVVAAQSEVDLDQTISGSIKPGSESLHTLTDRPNPAYFCVVDSDVSSQTRDATCLPISAENHSIEELDGGDRIISSETVQHSPNILEPTPEKKSNDHTLNELFQTENADKDFGENQVEGMVDSMPSILLTEEEFPCSVLPDVEMCSGITLVPDSSLETEVEFETSTSVVDVAQTDSLQEQQFLHETDSLQVVLDSIEVKSPYSEEKANLEDISGTADGEGKGGLINRVDAVGGDALPLELDKPDHGDHVNIVTETMQAIDVATPSAGADDGVSHVINASPGLVCSPSRNPINFPEPFSSLGVPHQKDLEFNGAISPEYPVESESQKDVNQLEVAPTELDFNPRRTVPGDRYNLEISNDDQDLSLAEETQINDEQDSYLAEETQINLCATDVITASSEVPSDWQLELKSSNQSHSLDISEDAASSPSCYLPEVGTSSEDASLLQTDQLNADCLHVDETSSKSSNLPTSPAHYLSEPSSPSKRLMELEADQPIAEFLHVDESISNSPNFQSPPTSSPLESISLLVQSMELQASQHGMECLQAVEASSRSLNLPGEQIQSQNPIDREKQLNASFDSGLEDHSSQPSSSRFFPLLAGHSAGQVLNGARQPADLLCKNVPSFGLLPMAFHTNLEETPPLPPLPPMQWRMGKVQHIPTASQRELHEQSQDSFTSMQPYTADEKTQFGFPASMREIVQSQNPFLPLTGVDSEKTQHISEQFVGNLAQPSTFSLQLSTWVNDANSQHDPLALEGTQPVNPFLVLPEVSNGPPAHGLPSIVGDVIHCGSNPFSLKSIEEYATSRHGTISSQETPIQPPNWAAPEAGLEAKGLQHSVQNSVVQEGNPLEKPMPAPNSVEGNSQHGILTSEGEATWSSNMLTLAPTYEVGKPNGNKLPRPRNPLIDAVAAHDKSKLRKVTERVRPQIGQKVEERDSLLEQIRTKSFNLKPAAVTRPSIQGPKTNLKVAAILEKANAIRQALAGSDEDDEEDRWSDS